jgi:hypothetical protein
VGEIDAHTPWSVDPNQGFSFAREEEFFGGGEEKEGSQKDEP